MNSTIADFQQLQARYSNFTDEELQAVAQDANDLTDAAKTVLQSEMLRRGLHFPPQPTASADAPSETADKNTEKFDPSNLDLIVVRYVWDREEARNIMRILHDAGIPCYLGPANLEDVDAFHSSFDDGVDIKVMEMNEQQAGLVLSHMLPAQPENETDYVARCPKCHSTEIVFQNLDDNPDAESSSIDVEKFNWSCDSCGYKWKDDGIEDKN
jgi:DNA-directed RNA polymerase subunit M/transcription elongation factor TFIIS